MLRAMRRELETGLRWLLHGHEEGNLGYSQGAAYGLPRQFPTLPCLRSKCPGAVFTVTTNSASTERAHSRKQLSGSCRMTLSSVSGEQTGKLSTISATNSG